MSSSKKGFGAGGGFGGKSKGKARAKVREVPYQNPHESAFAALGEPTGDLEQDSKEEAQALGAAFEGFKARAKKEQKRFEFAVDADFWFGVCFRSHRDKESFLRALRSHPRLYREQHVSGYELAEILGLEVEWSDRE